MHHTPRNQPSFPYPSKYRTTGSTVWQASELPYSCSLSFDVRGHRVRVAFYRISVSLLGQQDKSTRRYRPNFPLRHGYSRSHGSLVFSLSTMTLGYGVSDYYLVVVGRRSCWFWRKCAVH
jgi:hypothetical protein